MDILFIGDFIDDEGSQQSSELTFGLILTSDKGAFFMIKLTDIKLNFL